MASALRERTRPSGSRSWRAIADRLRRVAPRERVVLALAVMALTIVPVVFALARPPVRWSELVVMQAGGGTAARDGLVDHVRDLLRSDGFQARVAADRDSAWFAYESRLDEVEVFPARQGRSRALVRVPARTREQALDIARSVATVIAVQGSEAPRMVAAGRSKLRQIDIALRDPSVTPSRRRELLTERRFIRVAIGNLVPLRVVDPPSTPSISAVEALIEKIDESGAPRPSPLWAGLAGLMLGLALCCLRLARRPGPEADRTARPPGSR